MLRDSRASNDAAAVVLPQPPALAVHNLQVRFGGIIALSDVSFDVDHGEVVAVVGSNGAGKTTLLNAVSCMLRATSGEIFVAGRSVIGLQPRMIPGLGVGRSFQDARLLDDETVTANILCGAHRELRYSLGSQLALRRRVRAAEQPAVDYARQLLTAAGLGSIIDLRAAQLSFGIRKVVDFVRAAVLRPRLLLLDEPSSGLGSDEQSIVYSLLERLKADRSTAILLVEHHLDLVRAVADRALGMHAGRCLVSGATDEVLDSEEFRTALTGGYVSLDSRQSKGGAT